MPTDRAPAVPAAAAPATGLEVVPLSPVIGAEVRGVDLAADLDDATVAAIEQAWYAHLVLLFRGQRLTVEQHLAFAARLGPLDVPNHRSATEVTARYPALIDISNVTADGRLTDRGLGNAEAFWHTDLSYKERPPAGSALYAREVPRQGGNTCFCNMYRAYDDLPADLRAQAEGRTAVHDESRNSAMRLRPGYTEEPDPSRTPGPRHPIVRTHPRTGRKALFLGRRPFSYIPGLSVPESEALLDRLWAHATQEQYVYCHKWRVGDLILWDNRCVMHRRDAFDMSERRILHRTQIQGDRPC